MTERKFTPPTEFPAEYVTSGGHKAVVLGRAPVGDYPFVGYVLYGKDGSGWPECWTEKGSMFTIEEASEGDLHDIPREPIMRWMVIGGTNDGLCHPTEALALLEVAAYGGRVVKLVEEME